MVNEDILKRIKRGRLLGLKYSDLKSLLIKKGYNHEEINEAILAHFKKINKYSATKKMMHKFSKKSKKFAEKVSSFKIPEIKVRLPSIKIPDIKIPKKQKKIKRKIKKKPISKRKPIKKTIKPKKSAAKKQIKKPVIKTKKRISIKDPEKYFYFCNDKSAKNMTQFISIVKKLNHDEFRYHVNNDKNDFYNWIHDVVGDKDLANKLKDKTDKDKIINALK